MKAGVPEEYLLAKHFLTTFIWTKMLYMKYNHPLGQPRAQGFIRMRLPLGLVKQDDKARQ